MATNGLVNEANSSDIKDLKGQEINLRRAVCFALSIGTGAGQRGMSDVM